MITVGKDPYQNDGDGEEKFDNFIRNLVVLTDQGTTGSALAVLAYIGNYGKNYNLKPFRRVAKARVREYMNSLNRA